VIKDTESEPMKRGIRTAFTALAIALGSVCGHPFPGDGQQGSLAAQSGQFGAEEWNLITVTRETTPAVVGIQTNGGSGSGVIIRADGIIVTNAHVVGNARRVAVSLADGTEMVGEVLGRDPGIDIAIVRVAGTDLPVAPLGDSDRLEVGQLAIAIGNPFGFERTVTRGIVSGLNRSLAADLPELIQTDAAINQGNSGGPLLNSAGEVIGINTAVIQPGLATGLGFAVPINLARDVADQLLTTGVIRRALLGIYSMEITAELARQFGLPVLEGIIVTEVEEGSPAAAAGLRRGDIITRMGNSRIAGRGDMTGFLRQRRPGETVSIVGIRNRQEFTTQARLGEIVLQ
jgi:serine protease Do